MNQQKIIVKTESSNLWWGIYGLTEKIGWEDIELFYESGERVGYVCLNAKSYLRSSLVSLENKPDEKDFYEALQSYLTDHKCHYWFYYNKKEDEHFFEVPYEAPRNKEGIKPCFIDIWHSDESIGIQTIESAVAEFADKFLKIKDCLVEVKCDVTLEEALVSFKENEERFGGKSTHEIIFSEELVTELSGLWKMNNNDVLKKLKESI
jgi:hypothetical protein